MKTTKHIVVFRMKGQKKRWMKIDHGISLILCGCQEDLWRQGDLNRLEITSQLQRRRLREIDHQESTKRQVDEALRVQRMKELEAEDPARAEEKRLHQKIE